MANEYLQRTPTSTGNRKVFTWSGWVKKQQDAYEIISFSGPNTVSDGLVMFGWGTTTGLYLNFYSSSTSRVYEVDEDFRDFGSWLHYQISVDTTQVTEDDRINFYINGVQKSLSVLSGYSAIPQNYLCDNMTAGKQTLLGVGRNGSGNFAAYAKLELSDIFFVDGQALTPEVFGFYKDGNGYISAGSTQATDFRPGQWVPKTPRVIKAQIERNGGFGVNGFYLPMNDSSNFGADFHCDPNSIITLKGEDLPQPRNGAPTTTDAYVSQLRTDPYAANLVLAVPGIIGAPGVAYTDLSANIKGSGTNKVLTANGNAGVAVTASYYGSALSFDGTGDYFTVPNTADLRMGSDDFTIEAWLNKNDTTSGSIFGLYDNGNDRRSYLLFTDVNNDLTGIVNNDGTSGTNTTLGGSSSTNVGTNQWHHCALEREGSYVRLYLNGVVAGIATDLSGSLYENTVDTPAIGTWFNSGVVTGDVNGYIQDLRVYKGVAKYKGGFDVPKPYTPVGIGTWRAVPDTTANNFATINPLGSGAGTFTDGNLTYNSSSDTGNANIGISTGNFYYEGRVTNASPNDGYIGIMEATEQNPLRGGGWVTHGAIAYKQNGDQYFKGKGSGTSTSASLGDSYTTGDIIGIACDVTNDTVTFYKNGVSQGTTSQGPSSIQSNGTFTPLFYGSTVEWNINFGQNPTFSGVTTTGTYTDSNGKGLFKYEPPSGFLALCEDNLPTPAIKNPGEYFKTVLWTGDGAARSITGIGFTPDLVWIKRRTETADHRIFDSVRGPAKILYSSSSAQENPDTSSLTSFDDDGFSAVSDYGTNGNGGNFVAWCWRAGVGTTSTNTDGTIPSVVSANQDAGFSIVSWTSTGSNDALQTVGHGLNTAPNMIILKNRDAAVNWRVYHSGIPSPNNSLSLNTTEVAFNFWPSVGDDTFGLANSTTTGQASGTGNQDIIAYCWTEIEGFSKFGSYEGNLNADGPFVYCGFKPAWVMIKTAEQSGDWIILDSSRNPTNPCNNRIDANSSGEETPETLIDFLSNGFKLRTSSASKNPDGEKVVFMAFAESPFQTANSK